MKNYSILIALVLFIQISPLSAESGVEKTEKKELPKVLIIGDSISMGYTPFVIKLLKDKAIVKHNPGNAGPTMSGISTIDKYIKGEDKGEKWSVIHFNWGLWDMYGWCFFKDKRSPAEYEKRLDKLVAKLKKTGAVLIWGTTTPACPDPEVTMLKKFKQKIQISPELEKEYQAAALRIMKKYNVKIDDLYALMKPIRLKYALAPNNVHYTKEGYKILAAQVAGEIEKALK